MTVLIPKKWHILLLIGSCIAASGMVLLLNYVLAGPRLGAVYDILLGFRPSPPISREIVLIETDEVVEPGDLFSVLMTLNEMGASNLLVEVPVLGGGSGMGESGEEFSYRINDEFKLLTRNIQNLFEGIRLGLVSPIDSPIYVEHLVELAERGRDRLNAAIIRQDEEASQRVTQAEAAFGRTTSALDLRAPPSKDAYGKIPWYSRPMPDPDKILRRIAPVYGTPNAAAGSNGTEHIAYHALKPRWAESSVEFTGKGAFLVNRTEQDGAKTERRFPLDREGNILIEKINAEKFNIVTLGHFRDYDDAGKTLGRLLKEAESLGAYSETMPERIPLILFDFAEILRENLLREPNAENHAAWISAREDYIASLDEFLYGPAEMLLVNGYEVLIADDGIGEEGAAKLQVLRDALIRAFVTMREQHRRLIDLRNFLAGELYSAFCIMGAASFAAGADIPESSAQLANTLLTGRCITPGHSRYILSLSLIASFIVLFCIYRLKPMALLLIGISASLICGAGFGIGFIVSAYWIDPFIPTAACLTGTLCMTISKFAFSYNTLLRQYQ